MISEDTLRMIDRVAKSWERDFVIIITRDIVDYFTDIARVTDRVEMGGFLLGKLWMNHAAFYIYHDFVQVRNVSPTPEDSYTPEPNSEVEVARMVWEGKYDVLAMMHTHPDDSAFSVADLVTLRTFHVYVPPALRSRLPPDLVTERGGSQGAYPDFLVADGESPALYCYTYNLPFYFAAVEDGDIIHSEPSVSLFEDAFTYYRYLKRLVEEGIVKVGKPIEFVKQTLYSTHFVKVPIEELERGLSPEIELGGQEELRRLTEEMKERVRREIERRLKQL